MELLQGSQDVESDSVFCLCCLGVSRMCENAQNSQVMSRKESVFQKEGQRGLIQRLVHCGILCFIETCPLWHYMVENPFPKQDQGQAKVIIFISNWPH